MKQQKTTTTTYYVVLDGAVIQVTRTKITIMIIGSIKRRSVNSKPTVNSQQTNS